MPLLDGSALAIAAKALAAEASYLHPPVPVWADPPAPAWSPIQDVASNFSKVAPYPWKIEQQRLRVELTGTFGELHIRNKVSVRAKDPGVSKLTFLSRPLDSPQVFAPSAASAKVTVDLGDPSFVVLTVNLPVPLVVGASTEVVIDYMMTPVCDPTSLVAMTCDFGGQVTTVIGQGLILMHGTNPYQPFGHDFDLVTWPGTMGVGSGEPAGTSPGENGQQIWHRSEQELGIGGAFAIGEFAVVGAALAKPGKFGAPSVRALVLSDSTGVAEWLVVATDAISHIGKQTLTFPWTHLDFVQGQPGLGGRALLGTIFLGRELLDVPAGDVAATDATRRVLTHEVAHQWWGTLVHPHGLNDLFLSESMAEYFACAYAAEKLGSRKVCIENGQSYLYTVPPGKDVAVAGNDVMSSAYIVPVLYHKGSVVLDMLRLELGDTLFYKALASFLAGNYREYASLDDFRGHIQQAAGTDLDWFFKQWLFGTGAIRIALTGRTAVTDGVETWRMRVRWPGAKLFRFSLPVTLHLADGSAVEHLLPVLPPPSGNELIIEVAAPAEVISAEVDPDHVLLRQATGETAGDIDLNGHVDGADLVALAFASGSAVVATKQGKTGFLPDAAFDERFDLWPDYRVDLLDADVVISHAGAHAEAF